MTQGANGCGCYSMLESTWGFLADQTTKVGETLGSCFSYLGSGLCSMAQQIADAVSPFFQNFGSFLSENKGRLFEWGIAALVGAITVIASAVICCPKSAGNPV